MSIAVSTQKDGQVALYVNDSLSSVDNIAWREMVLIERDDQIFCFGLLGADCYGLVNHKDKAWTADGAQVSFRVHGGSSKLAWSKADNKFMQVTVSKDELHLYSLLKKVSDTNQGQILTGFISPWVNPYFWDFVKTPEDVHRAEKINREILSLSPRPQDKLTQSEIDGFISTLASAKAKSYGSGSKGETEAERLKVRYEFLKLQFADVCEFTDLYDLAGQIVSIGENNANLSPDKLIELSVVQLLDLTSIILGGK